MPNLTYNDLIEKATAFSSAGLLNLNDEITLTVGDGSASKTIIGYTLSDEGLRLRTSGNAPTTTIRKTRKKKAATTPDPQPEPPRPTSLY